MSIDIFDVKNGGVNMKENWKPIKGYEGLYEVSNFGRIRSLDRIDSLGRIKKGQELKPNFDGRKNYLHVNLSKNGKKKSVQVHTLVANAFCNNPNKYNEINHIDECKTNNRAENLEWCTRSYNNSYGTLKDSKLGEKNPQNKIDKSAALYIKRNYKPRDKKFGAIPLAKKYGISESHVCHIASSERWCWLAPA